MDLAGHDEGAPQVPMNTTSDPLRVGFIGLGSQGGPMARRIIEVGYGSPAELAADAALALMNVSR